MLVTTNDLLLANLPRTKYWCKFVRSFVRSFVCHSFVRSFVCSFVLVHFVPFVRSLICRTDKGIDPGTNHLELFNRALELSNVVALSDTKPHTLPPGFTYFQGATVSG